MNEEKLYSVEEAAEIIGICTAQVYRYIRAGVIRAEKRKPNVIGRMKYYIPASDVDRLGSTKHWKRWTEMEEGILQALAYDPKFKWEDIGQALKRTPEACRCHFERLTYRSYGMKGRKG